MNKVSLANFEGLSQHWQRVYIFLKLSAPRSLVTTSKRMTPFSARSQWTIPLSLHSQSTGNEKQGDRQEKANRQVTHLDRQHATTGGRSCVLSQTGKAQVISVLSDSVISFSKKSLPATRKI
jgi:hypothetical protein